MCFTLNRSETVYQSTGDCRREKKNVQHYKIYNNIEPGNPRPPVGRL